MLWTVFLLGLWLNISNAQEIIYGKNKYIEYQVGNMSLILTAPHGGSLTPSSIPTRDTGCWEKATGNCYYTHSCPSGSVKDSGNCKVTTVKDLYTQEMAFAVAKEICRLTSGYSPHIVINNLSRSKLDPNRDKDEAAFGVPDADQAWDEFMGFIRSAKSHMSQGLLIDIHGQSHPEQWIELGYLISKANLDSGKFSASDTSIYALSKRRPDTSFEELLRGRQSLGMFIEEQNVNYVCVPSPSNPGPNGGAYFSGGFITSTHGSKISGEVDAIQIELPKWIRESVERSKFAAVLAKAILNFYQFSFEKM
ncbi:uncharacterized protein LOC122946438 isoform X2 [Bufo gargarizans]|nr:uncharacterized protein LOC122946438 isoform X2 [Bufo gargarizans]XP_044162011.1 uncharacterized protein LOC122946438 isoform X2 [Bufo gargarizans]XP_044162012.1 uncharacterized protein LOC122946438 isoform X2 [Bufo gargarizans]